MYDSPFQETDLPYQQAYGPGPACRHRSGIMRTALMWAAIAVVAMVAFGAVSWAFGVVFAPVGTAAEDSDRHRGDRLGVAAFRPTEGSQLPRVRTLDTPGQQVLNGR
jgi:hypothetical protein